MNLEQPLFLILIPLGIWAAWKVVRQKSVIGFPSGALLKSVGRGLPLLTIERVLLSVFVVAAVLILARPIEVVRNSVPTTKEARDITIVLDHSGSMNEVGEEKAETAKLVITKFVEGRPGDRISLYVFDTKAYLEWPLSPDHASLVYRLDKIVMNGGTVIASGIIAGLKHQQEYGQNPGALIVVSDGISKVSPDEKGEIKNALGRTQIYMIWIGDQDQELAMEFGNFIRSLGGIVYRGDVEELSGFFAQIDKLETTPVVWDISVSYTYHFGALPLVALASLLCAGVVNMFREV